MTARRGAPKGGERQTLLTCRLPLPSIAAPKTDVAPSLPLRLQLALPRLNGTDGAVQLQSIAGAFIPEVSSLRNISSSVSVQARPAGRGPVTCPLPSVPVRQGGDGDGVDRAWIGGPSWIGDGAGVSSQGLFRVISLFRLQPEFDQPADGFGAIQFPALTCESIRRCTAFRTRSTAGLGSSNRLLRHAFCHRDGRRDLGEGALFHRIFAFFAGFSPGSSARICSIASIMPRMASTGGSRRPLGGEISVDRMS
jgi:hypothetical protein